MHCELIWVSLTAVASWALVFVTWFLVSKQIKVASDDMKEQIKVMREGVSQQLKMSRDDLKARLQITYEEKFDSPRTEETRSSASHQFTTC